jgi:hypothetical protein
MAFVAALTEDWFGEQTFTPELVSVVPTCLIAALVLSTDGMSDMSRSF